MATTRTFEDMSIDEKLAKLYKMLDEIIANQTNQTTLAEETVEKLDNMSLHADGYSLED